MSNSSFVPSYDGYLHKYTRHEWQQCVFYMNGRLMAAFKKFQSATLPNQIQEYMEQEVWCANAVVGFATNKFPGIWVPRDLVYATHVITESPLSAKVFGFRAASTPTGRLGGPLPSYTYDWWNHLATAPDTPQLSTLRQALAAFEYDRNQMVPGVQEGDVVPDLVREFAPAGTGNLSSEEFATRRVLEGQKQIQIAIAGVQEMRDRLIAEMDSMHTVLTKAGFEVETPADIISTKRQRLIADRFN